MSFGGCSAADTLTIVFALKTHQDVLVIGHGLIDPVELRFAGGIDSDGNRYIVTITVSSTIT